MLDRRQSPRGSALLAGLAAGPLGQSWSGVRDCLGGGEMAPQGQSTADPSAGMGPTRQILRHCRGHFDAALPWLKVAHGIDGGFYFDNTDKLPMTDGVPSAPPLAKTASTAWASFARSGKPAAPALPAWPACSLERRETMILGETPHVARNPLGADREFRVKLGVWS
jgi:hypothetical protein